MSSQKIYVCTEVVEETYEVQWKIKNFLKILQSNAVETLKLAIVTGESSSSESKWIFGFHKRNSKWYEEPCYLEAIHLPQYMDQIAVKLLVQNVPTNNIRKEWRGKATHETKNNVLKLNQQMKGKIIWNSDQVQGLVDSEGTMTLDLTLTVFLPKTC